MIQRDDLYIDSTGRAVLSNDETCVHCNAPSRVMHPAGVVPGSWLCTRCGKRQDEPVSNHIAEED